MNIQDTLKELQLNKKISVPNFLIDGLSYATLMGSVSYGASQDNSDLDVYGITIPPIEILFPFLAGEIPGFGQQVQRFKSYTQSHIDDGDVEYDFNIYNIVSYFQLAMENNPNVLDSLFVYDEHVLYQDEGSQFMRENREVFLHKGSFHKYTGYAHSQLNKMEHGSNSKNPKRLLSIEKYGFDVKFGYQAVRLMLQLEDILKEHTMDIQKHAQVLRDIRNGKWEKEQLIQWVKNKEQQLKVDYQESTLRHSPDEQSVRNILVKVLKMKFGKEVDFLNTKDKSKPSFNL